MGKSEYLPGFKPGWLGVWGAIKVILTWGKGALWVYFYTC